MSGVPRRIELDQHVPFLDLARGAAAVGEELEEAVLRVVRSGRYLLADELERFEHAFASAIDMDHVVGVATGTDALRLIMTAMGIGIGDEVIVPALTAVPTAAAACAVGATPVCVDVDAETAAIDVDAARAAITDKTKAIIPVHLYGRPAPIDELAQLGMPIIEDAAQAHLALDPAVASRSAAVAYSFYPTKNLGSLGDGGAVATSDAELAEKIRLLRAHGQSELYRHVEIATSSRLSEINAAALSVGLQHLEAWTERRRQIAQRYREAAPGLRWQANHPRHVHHLAVLRVEDRDGFRREMSARGVDTAVHYPLSVIEQPAYEHLARWGCPEASRWAQECVSIPCSPHMEAQEVDHVAASLVAIHEQEGMA